MSFMACIKLAELIRRVNVDLVIQVAWATPWLPDSLCQRAIDRTHETIEMANRTNSTHQQAPAQLHFGAVQIAVIAAGLCLLGSIFDQLAQFAILNLGCFKGLDEFGY